MAFDKNNFSYASLEFAAQVDDGAARFLRRLECDSYDKFAAMLYIDLEQTISLIEKNASLHQKDGEDRLSIEIINILTGFGFIARHDEFINGHSDIVVTYKKFMWIGEAKIHSTYDYLMEGFVQLCDRYSIGNEDDCEGGLLFYVKGNNTLNVVEKWKETLLASKIHGLTVSQCNTRSYLSFYSVHKHPKSGLPYKVRHIGVILGFEPKDKSARQSKKGQN